MTNLEPILPDSSINVNDSNISDNSDMDMSIQRCPHDEENPYAIISRQLIRDASISPECRWLLIYLLSMKDGWKINVKQLVAHLKPHMGRNRVYAAVNEAIEAGYMKREEIKTSKGKNNLITQFKYYVSERPKFKKCFRHPGFRDTENKDIKDIVLYKKKHITPPIPPLATDLPKGAEAAKAAEMEIEHSPKIKRSKPEFNSKVREVGNQIINSLLRAKPDYSHPKNLSPLLTEVDFLLRLDKRNPEKVIDVLNWALADSFWIDKMFKPNPAKYLREKFDQLEMKMNAKPFANPNQVDRRLRDKDGQVVDAYKDLMF